MDLWIRSQDRENLIQTTRLFIAFDKNIATWDRNTMINLGKYSTKERALEVLDEIEKIFDFRIVDKSYQEIDLFLKANMFPKIYKMPKE